MINKEECPVQSKLERMQSGSEEHKPEKKEVLYSEEKEPDRWDALLDRGSSFAVVPNRRRTTVRDHRDRLRWTYYLQDLKERARQMQGLQILLMSGGSVTSASQILESFWNIWSQVSDFPARGPGMYTLS